MSAPIVYIYPPPGGFLSLPANPFYDHRRDREERMRTMEEGDLAKEFSHFCDVCERGFDTEHQYRSHLSKHIWCDVPGCRFTCLKDKEWKMEMHKSTLHDRDDAPDLLNTEKYLATRRKKFPTGEKILTKMEEYRFRVARGDYITKDQWKWLKRQEYMTMMLKNIEKSGDYLDNAAFHSSGQSKEEENIDEDTNSGTDIEGYDKVSNSSNISQGDQGPAEDQHRITSMIRGDQISPTVCQESNIRQNRIIRRPKKRKRSLFEKLTAEERINEKGLVLQALRYFAVTEFLKQSPRW